MTLTEFVLVRIVEDEAVARTNLQDQVDAYCHTNGPETDDPCSPGQPYNSQRHRAGCQAKRQIIKAYLEERFRRDLYQSTGDIADEDHGSRTRRLACVSRTRGLEIAVETLARPYADHPDYRAKWRP